jgi:hypothetical protein
LVSRANHLLPDVLFCQEKNWEAFSLFSEIFFDLSTASCPPHLLVLEVQAGKRSQKIGGFSVDWLSASEMKQLLYRVEDLRDFIG